MKELPSEEEEIPFRIKTYKKKELAGYHPRTRTFTPRQVQIITSILDIP